MKQNVNGFTLLEILIVLTIIGILAAIFGMSLVKSLRTAELREATNQVAADFRRARSQAQRQSAQIIMNLPGTGVALASNTYRVDTVTRTLANGITMYCKSGCTAATLNGKTITNVTYLPPYGETGIIGSIYVLHSPTPGVADLEIRLVGVTGKAVVAKAGS